MRWADIAVPPLRDEVRFDGRRLRCFASRPAHVDAMFREAAEAAPEAPALVAAGRTATYRDLDRQVSGIARGLLREAIAPGDRVAFALGNRIEFVALFLACARIGAIGVPLNPRMRLPEFEYVLSHSGARLFVHEAGIADRIPDLPPGDCPRFSCGGPAPGARAWRKLAADGNGDFPPPPAEEDTAAILYTSGTTGQPKGALLTHLGIVHSCMHFEVCWRIERGERLLLAVPASHVTGLVSIILTAIRVGGCTVMMERFRAADCLALAAEHRITATILVPAMYALCLMEPDLAAFDLSAWRIGGYGGAPMPEATIRDLAARLPGLVPVNAYGATETTSPTTIMPPGRTPDHADTVGRVVPCGEVRIVDGDGRTVPPGQPGEILIAGPMVVPGYHDNPQATQENFIDGFWRSGDIGSLDADGYLRIHDRLKDMINRAGYKVWSAEVENVMSHHPAVAEVAVVGRPDPVLGERVHAFVVLRDPGADAEVLRDFCVARLSGYKVPESFTFPVEPLPRNANGKIRKTVLRERLAAGD